jgi:membrane protease YdiL (CAAX protease family)
MRSETKPATATTNPLLVRTLPFLVFVGLTAMQGSFGEASRYWIYAAKTAVGGWLIWRARPWIQEMRWQMGWDAMVVGILVFAFWVGLDSWYPSAESLLKRGVCPGLRHLGFGSWCDAPPSTAAPWNPQAQFGPALAWFFILTRLLGSSLVVPPIEEVFYRSFVYRSIASAHFESVPLSRFSLKALLGTAVIFGFAHYEWLPGIVCGLLYQALVIRHNALGRAMAAHAITNFLLGIWIVCRGAWHFW